MSIILHGRQLRLKETKYLSQVTQQTRELQLGLLDPKACVPNGYMILPPGSPTRLRLHTCEPDLGKPGVHP